MLRLFCLPVALPPAPLVDWVQLLLAALEPLLLLPLPLFPVGLGAYWHGGAREQQRRCRREQG